jgi:hypothetical protein
MKIISLGWGVQSFTLAAMSALGELPKVDYAIHADTTHESQLTYEFARKWTPWLEERGVKVVTVKPDPNKLNAFDNYRGVFIPAYTHTPEHYEISDGYYIDSSGEETINVFDPLLVGQKIKKTASDGQLNRQCTGDWKIAPMRRWLQEHRNGESIEQWIGISLDEFQRMKPSDVKYITTVWPLIELKMTRKDCEKWLLEHNLETPAKSACTFCPYHNTKEWRRIKANKTDWKSAIDHDNAIRKVRPPFDLFVHPSRKPLDQVDFRTAEEKGQLSLWDNECTGMCGV